MPTRSFLPAPILAAIPAAILVLLCAGLAACASLGDTPQDKRNTILEMRDQTMARLFDEKPAARVQVAEAAGYGVFDAASQNLIVLQTGGGYGVLTAADGEVTFMKVGGAGVGFGIGLKDYREVIIFREQSDFDRFRRSGWEASGQAEASAQGGKKGGSAAAKQSIDLDVVTYQLMASGVALQATVGASKYWKWSELNR
ncbi:MAG: hypothetical protein RQ741_12140 [Wenzhouxiangellaceae bacterium]|nr:hypothetical protein [Wenzhouxiangellaceae bacterium]